MNKKRIQALDSLRGIAALSVVFHHCFISSPKFWEYFSGEVGMIKNNGILSYILVYTPLHTIWNGPSAVFLFFVLSGYVLSKSLNERPEVSYMSYVIKRMCRLYIPYLVAIVISIILLNFFFYQHIFLYTASQWFNDMWSHQVSLNDFFKYLVLEGDFHNIDTTLWSIAIEIKISVLFPLIFLLFYRLNFCQSLLAIFIYILSYHTLIKFIPQEIVKYISFGFYITFFLAGIFVYKFEKNLSFLITRKLFFIPLLIISLFLFNSQFIWRWFPNELQLLFKKLPEAYYILASCMFFILTFAQSGEKNIISAPVFVKLGKISYSLYLIHPIILLVSMYILFPNITYLPLILSIVILFSLLLSTYYYKFIEEPSQKFGKYITKKIL